MEVVLDGAHIHTEADIHDALISSLGLGIYYGRNVAALWDRLSTDVERPVRLIWKNASRSRVQLGDETFERFATLFKRVEEQDASWGLIDRFTFLIQ